MTKPEAKQEMRKGNKVTHHTFSDHEWITGGLLTVLTEEGYKLDATEFWRYREHPNFDDGWELWKEK